ncbi:MAG TPA: bifunctional hydroxymethylpyrimidine kinase/phosphomethylpyrimidine kinase [Geopsychrobacteraceae bacterium]|nr:bifunctional hydroxymethylpyrimidine kinase/phosphomethylpyrimidine kinase [Geopsychrobacteraceae bacterium]
MLSGLYLITDDNRDGKLLNRVQQALLGGTRILQYRAKHQSPSDRLAMAEQLRTACHEAGAKLIINDSPELAQEVDADGIHLGQDDMSVGQARQLLGRDKLIGVSTHNVDEALKAESHGADYIALGSVFATSSKEDTNVVGIEMLSKVRRAVRIPLVAIGGIDPAKADLAIEAGADSVAVISGVMNDLTPAIAAREYSLLFNRGKELPYGRVLTIAGSDSGGGAGIQADLKTITLLGSYGSSVLTALTAQNTLGVDAVEPVQAGFVSAQIDAVLSDIGTDTVKTGMLNWGGNIIRIARAIQKRALLAIVDPVMVAKGGAKLLDQEAIDSLIAHLIPRAYLLTPNLPEAEALTGMPVENEREMEQAGRSLQELGARNVLIKGGHLKNNQNAIDLLLIGEQIHRFESPRIDTKNTHGTGCTYSAAIATFLAQGYPLLKAVELSKKFIDLAIEHAVDCGQGRGPVNHYRAAQLLAQEDEVEN